MDDSAVTDDGTDVDEQETSQVLNWSQDGVMEEELDADSIHLVEDATEAMNLLGSNTIRVIIASVLVTITDLQRCKASLCDY